MQEIYRSLALKDQVDESCLSAIFSSRRLLVLAESAIAYRILRRGDIVTSGRRRFN